jgi:hypothetical protein
MTPGGRRGFAPLGFVCLKFTFYRFAGVGDIAAQAFGGLAGGEREGGQEGGGEDESAHGGCFR